MPWFTGDSPAYDFTLHGGEEIASVEGAELIANTNGAKLLRVQFPGAAPAVYAGKTVVIHFRH